MKKKTQSSNLIQTSSLPDIVFILLFFFMVVTHVKEADPLMEIHEPEASCTDRISNASLVDHIYIGKMDGKEVLQLDDGIAQLQDIRPWVEDNVIRRADPDKSKIIRALHVDGKIKMERVSQVKQELRKADALKVLYSTIPQSK